MPGNPDDILQTSSPLASYHAYRSEINAAIQRILDQPAYVLGPAVADFESGFSSYVGVPYGIGVNSGTDALHFALRAMGIGTGDEVITVSHTSVATVAAIEMSGAQPVLVDVELPWCTIDPAEVESAIGPRTRAIVAVHLYGQPADLTRLRAICDSHGLALIEDCAQSHGALWNGRQTGSWGDAACFSFYPSKNLGTVGDGGMVVTSDPELAQRLRSFRQYGWEQQPQLSQFPGWNSRLGPLQAAILGVKLKHLDRDIARRRSLAAAYREELAALPLLLPDARPHSEHAYHLFVVICEGRPVRDRLIAHLLERRIAAGIHYPFPVHSQPAYRGRLRILGLSRTDTLSGQILSLPLYPELLASQQARVIKALQDFFGT